ncbi:MAG: phosphorylcholine transferase LicD [Oscillospiraceae bacterium]
MNTACKTVEFTKEELRALQLKGLEMLLYFKDFCDRHGLLFYFCGGCCIGALREKGFVPWDDDVDVFMPREDYEKLGRLWNAEADTDRYSYCRSGKEINYRNLFATVNDNATTYQPHQADLDVCHGLMIDICRWTAARPAVSRKMQMFGRCSIRFTTRSWCRITRKGHHAAGKADGGGSLQILAVPHLEIFEKEY